MNWIRVTDARPEEKVVILAAIHDSNGWEIVTAYMAIEYDWQTDAQFYPWYTPAFDDPETRIVTHWMPLPKPPEAAA